MDGSCGGTDGTRTAPSAPKETPPVPEDTISCGDMVTVFAEDPAARPARLAPTALSVTNAPGAGCPPATESISDSVKVLIITLPFVVATLRRDDPKKMTNATFLLVIVRLTKALTSYL
jgi:hypothetical protein